MTRSAAVPEVPPPTARPSGDAPRWLTYVRMSDVLPALRNPRKHDLARLTDYITRFGFTSPLEADERTQRLVSGHGRLTALVTIRAAGEPMPNGLLVDDDGEWLVPIYRGWRSSSDAEAEAYLIAANLAAERATWDEWGMGPMLEDLNAADPELFALLDLSDEDMESMVAKHQPEVDPDDPAALTDAGTQAALDADDDEGDRGEAADDAPLVGGDQVERTVECPSCSYVFRPGHPDDVL